MTLTDGPRQPHPGAGAGLRRVGRGCAGAVALAAPAHCRV